MSNVREFDYTEISNIYNSMNQIIGDNSDPTSIAGLLYKIDNEYQDVVNGPAGEDALAIYGDLGAQLLLDWKNTAGSFPAFVENFSAWSTVVAQTAGDYANFEQQVKGIRSDNPLGWSSGGIQTGYVASSTYNQSYTDEQLDEYAAGVQMYQQVGAYYVDTGMVSYASKNAFWNGFGDVLSVVGIVASGFSLVKGLGIVGGAAGTAGGTSGGAAGLIDDGGNAVRLGIVDGSDDAAKLTYQQALHNVRSGNADAGSIWKLAQTYGNGSGGTAITATPGSFREAEQIAANLGKKILNGTADAADSELFLGAIYRISGDITADQFDDLVANLAANYADEAATLAGNSVQNVLTSSVSNSGAALSTNGGSIMTQSIDDLIASGKPIANGSLYGLTDDVASASDKLISQGYTLVDDTWQLPTKINAGNSMFTSSAQKSAYYAKEALRETGTNIKNGLSTAGTTIKNGLSTAGSAVKTAGTWVYQNGVPVLKETVTGLGTSGIIGQAANVGQNAVDTYQLNRTAEMVARANERFGNNGN